MVVSGILVLGVSDSGDPAAEAAVGSVGGPDGDIAGRIQHEVAVVLAEQDAAVFASGVAGPDSGVTGAIDNQVAVGLHLQVGVGDGGARGPLGGGPGVEHQVAVGLHHHAIVAVG